MSDIPSYEELAVIVEMLQNRVNSLESDYVRIRREPAIEKPSSLAGGEGVLTSDGIWFGINGGVVGATLR